MNNKFAIDFVKLKLIDFERYLISTKKLCDNKLIADEIEYVIADIRETREALGVESTCPSKN